MNNQVVVGSLGDIAIRSGISLAETFVNAECIVIVDLSGSMESADSRDGMQRYKVAFQDLRSLQRDLPGKLAVIGFADSAQFFPGGQPVMGLCGTTTNLAGALDFARLGDAPGIRFIIISDGQPNDQEKTLLAAKKFKGRIDVIYVGPEGGMGRRFLERLAKANGGVMATADRVRGLAAVTERLLLNG